MSTLQEIESEDSFQSLLQNASPATLHILYFHTPWAAPCAQMKQILTALASTYPAESNLSFLSINAEELPEISETYDVTAVPFLVLVKDNKTLDTVTGSDASKVRSAVEKHAGTSGQAGKVGIPPALEATPQANGPTATKDLSSYAPAPSDPATAPEQTSTSASKEELWTRLGNLVKAAPVMLFMKGTPSAPQCGFSRQLVGILRENNVRYGFFNILADDDVRQGLKEYSDWPTFPQLYADGELVGGLDIVKEELSSDADFFKPYAATQANTGGPAAPEKQTAAA